MAQSLQQVLEPLQGEDAWWAPSLWAGDYRMEDRWEQICAAVLDIDYLDGKGAKVDIPALDAMGISDAAQNGTLAGAYRAGRTTTTDDLVKALHIDRDKAKRVLKSLEKKGRATAPEEANGVARRWSPTNPEP